MTHNVLGPNSHVLMVQRLVSPESHWPRWINPAICFHAYPRVCQADQVVLQLDKAALLMSLLIQ